MNPKQFNHFYMTKAVKEFYAPINGAVMGAYNIVNQTTMMIPQWMFQSAYLSEGSTFARELNKWITNNLI